MLLHLKMFQRDYSQIIGLGIVIVDSFLFSVVIVHNSSQQERVMLF